jgi:chromosome segregation ATPase
MPEEARNDEIKQLLMTTSRMEENMKNMSEQIKEVSKLTQLALQTDTSVKSAHNRINDLKTEFTEKLNTVKTDSEKELNQAKGEYEYKLNIQDRQFRELKSNITWLWRTVGAGAITTIFGVIIAVIKYFMQ